MKKYCTPDVYQRFFYETDEKSSYGNYIGVIHNNGHSYTMKKCDEETFYKSLSKILDKLVVQKTDQNTLEILKKEAENQTLLPLARTKANGVIPNQIHIQELRAILDNAKTYDIVGCKKCNNTGYYGRIGIFEVLSITDTIRELITRGASSIEIRKAALEEGYRPFIIDGIGKVISGITTLDELNNKLVIY